MRHAGTLSERSHASGHIDSIDRPMWANRSRGCTCASACHAAVSPSFPLSAPSFLCARGDEGGLQSVACRLCCFCLLRALSVAALAARVQLDASSCRVLSPLRCGVLAGDAPVRRRRALAAPEKRRGRGRRETVGKRDTREQRERQTDTTHGSTRQGHTTNRRRRTAKRQHEKEKNKHNENPSTYELLLETPVSRMPKRYNHDSLRTSS